MPWAGDSLGESDAGSHQGVWVLMAVALAVSALPVSSGHQKVPLDSSLPAPGIHGLLSVTSSAFPFLEFTSWKCTLWCLISFAGHRVSEIHTCSLSYC